MLLFHQILVLFVSRRYVLLQVVQAGLQKVLIDLNENSIALESNVSLRKIRPEAGSSESEALFPLRVNRLVQAQSQRVVTPVQFLDHTDGIGNNGVTYLGLRHDSGHRVPFYATFDVAIPRV